MLFGSKKNAWVVHVTILSIVLGILFAASLKMQQRVRRDYGGSTRVPILAERLHSQELANTELQAEVADLRKEVASYQRKLSDGSVTSEELVEQLQEANFLAGLRPVTGTGVMITLQDAKNPPIPQNSSLELIMAYMVHAEDIQSVVNELRNAGAEAISVNGQRLVAMSAVRCAGNIVLINHTPVTPPFKVEAVGDPDTLSDALLIPGGVADELSSMGKIKIEKSKVLRLKGYTGLTRFNFAKALKEGS